MNRKDTIAAIRAIGCTAKFSEGEYRISINPAEILRGTGCTGTEAMARNESLAAYCSDSDDAIATARHIRAAWEAEIAPATAEPEPAREVKTIDMTPTWAAVSSIFIMALENGTETGKAAARTEIRRMAELADERNALAKELARRESAELSDVIQEYPLKGDGCQAPGAIVLRRLDGNDVTPFVVHFRNDQDSERVGRPCYYFGDYCTSLADGWRAFADKVARYDPTGALAA